MSAGHSRPPGRRAGAALEVADQDDPSGHPAGLLAGVGHILNRGDGVDQAAAQVGRCPGRLQFGEPRAGRRPPGVGLQRRRLGEGQRRAGSSRRRPDGQLVAGSERRRWPPRPSPTPASRDPPAHAGAGVDQHGDPRRSTVPGVEPRGLAEERPGERQCEQDQRGGPEEQQQPVIQPTPPGHPRGGRRQEHQRAERASRPRGERRIRWKRIGAAMAGPRGCTAASTGSSTPSPPAGRPPARHPAAALAGLEEVEQDQFERAVGRDRREFDAQVGAGPLDLRRMLAEPRRYSPRAAAPDRRRARGPTRRPGTWPACRTRRRLRRVEDPEDDHVMPPRPQVAEPGPQGVGRGQQVGDQHDQPALA